MPRRLFKTDYVVFGVENVINIISDLGYLVLLTNEFLVILVSKTFWLFKRVQTNIITKEFFKYIYKHIIFIIKKPRHPPLSKSPIFKE